MREAVRTETGAVVMRVYCEHANSLGFATVPIDTLKLAASKVPLWTLKRTRTLGLVDRNRMGRARATGSAVTKVPFRMRGAQ
jgi:hypothetical protein